MRRISTILSIAFAIILLPSCANMYLSKGKEDFANLKYMNSIQSLERSVEKKPNIEASTLLALAYAETNQPVAAIYEFQKVNNDPAFDDNLKLAYASALLSAKKYDEAEVIANGILSRDPGNQVAQSVKISANRVDKMKKDSSLYQLTPFHVTGVKTAMSVSKTSTGYLISGEVDNAKIKDNYTGLSFLDVFEMDSLGNTKKLPFSDSKYHDAMAIFSKDGNTAYFTRSNQTRTNKLEFDSKNTSNPQLYKSTKSGTSWSKPEKLAFNNASFIYAHPALTSDDQTLYFSSNKDGGSGGMDLYMTELTAGVWGEPKNLGPTINSQGDEAFPTLKDNNTLYFSSNGHQTLGGLDILFSELKDDNWSSPIQLSYPLNSSMDDFGMVYIEKDKGLLTSDRSGLDGLYSFEQFYPTLSIDGNVLEAETGDPIPKIQITIKNLTDNTTDIILSDMDGKFTYQLLPNKKYEIIAEDLNEDQIYFNSSQKISTMGLREDETFDIDFNLERIVIPNDPNNIIPGGDGTYPIPNIYWNYNDWEVRVDAQPYLNMLSDLLKTNPSLKVEIRSHCDSRGSDSFNRTLSKKRAKSAMNYLISNGIERNRLTSKGIGEKEILNNCIDGVTCFEEQHQINRRSEFIVIDKSGNNK
tara:strand:+ start:24971 stop:26890 length:1920 start_codon:yes stop_codon:yes gene_type:complete